MSDDALKNGYPCPICGLHYAEKETAEACERWCTEKRSCNTEIIKLALENRP
ncbi:MAG: hypothetical protein AAB562_01100 [Patescibacteria group bacterium]